MKEPMQVLRAIDARGTASRIVKSGIPDGCTGELWLSGQAGIDSTFFKNRNIKLCVTAAHGLQKRFKTFEKRRARALKSNDAELIKLGWVRTHTHTHTLTHLLTYTQYIYRRIIHLKILIGRKS